MDQNRKILLVDDEPDFRDIMAKLFNRKQLEHAAAGGCMEALDLLSKDAFDVIIMDIAMPGLNGLECMAEIKKLYPCVEVIVLTGHGSLQAGLAGMKQGAFDYCLKPVDFGEIMEKVTLAREQASDNFRQML